MKIVSQMIQKNNYYLSKLKSGANVLIHPIDGSKTTTIAVAYGAGSRYETRENNGISHFLEHMFFKGTEFLTCDDVNKTFAKLGAVTNAFTYYNVTYYYAKGPSVNLDAMISLWADLLQHAALREEDFLKEKQVVIEELESVKDNPTHYINTKTIEFLFEETNWGLPLGGTIEAIKRMKLEEMKTYRQQHYSLLNALILVIGECQPDEVLSRLEDEFNESHSPANGPGFEKIMPRWKKSTKEKLNISIKKFIETKNLPATYVNVALEAPGTLDTLYYALELLNVGLGEARTSKLYQDIVRTGLALRCNSNIVSQPDVSAWLITARLSKDKLEPYFRKLWNSLDEFRKQRINDELKEKWFKQLKGTFLVDMERPTELAFWLALRYWETGEIVTLEDHLNRLARVSVLEMEDLKNQLFSDLQAHVLMLGDVDPHFDVPLVREK